MIIKGTIQEINKRYTKSLAYGYNRDSQGVGDYSYCMIIAGEPYYYRDIPLGKKTEEGDEMILFSDTDNEVLAWKNITKNCSSNVTLFHIVFDTYVVLWTAFLAVWWYGVKDKPDILNFVYFGGIPLWVLMMIYIFAKGAKKLTAQRKIANEQ